MSRRTAEAGIRRTQASGEHSPGTERAAETGRRPRSAARRAVRAAAPEATTAGRSAVVSRSTSVGSRATSRPRARSRASWARPVRAVLMGTPRKARRVLAGAARWPTSRRRRRARARRSRRPAMPRAWSRSAAVTWGVSMPIWTPGPPATDQAWASRRDEAAVALGDDVEARRQPGTGVAVEGKDPPAGARRGHRLERVGQRRFGQRGRLDGRARGAQPGLHPARDRRLCHHQHVHSG